MLFKGAERFRDTAPPQLLQARRVEIPRQRQYQRDLRQLRRLQIEHAEVDPALRAHADRALQLDRHQQRDADEIHRVGEPQPHPHIDQRGDEQHRQAEAEPPLRTPALRQVDP